VVVSSISPKGTAEDAPCCSASSASCKLSGRAATILHQRTGTPNTHESYESCSQLLSVAEGMVMLPAQRFNAGECDMGRQQQSVRCVCVVCVECVWSVYG